MTKGASLTALLVLCTFVTLFERTARATVKVVDDPYGDSASTAYLGTISSAGTYPGTWVAFHSGSSCTLVPVGNTSGLTFDVVVHGKGGNDSLNVLTTTISWCTQTMSPPAYNGHYVQLWGEAGNDYLSSGSGPDTQLIGGDGADYIVSYYGSAGLWGDAGSGADGADTIFDLASSGISGIFDAGGGNDCLWLNPGLSPASQTCGAGTDQWYGPGTRPSDCESTSVDCCGTCE